MEQQQNESEHHIDELNYKTDAGRCFHLFDNTYLIMTGRSSSSKKNFNSVNDDISSTYVLVTFPNNLGVVGGSGGRIICGRCCGR